MRNCSMRLTIGCNKQRNITLGKGEVNGVGEGGDQINTAVEARAEGEKGESVRTREILQEEEKVKEGEEEEQEQEKVVVVSKWCRNTIVGGGGVKTYERLLLEKLKVLQNQIYPQKAICGPLELAMVMEG